MANFEQSRQPARWSVIGLAVAYLALAWAGNASVAAWNVYEYPYNDDINFIDVFRDMLSLPIGDVVSTGFTQFGLVNLAMLVSFVFAAVAMWSDPIRRGLLIAASVTAIPFGLLGLLSLGAVAVMSFFGTGRDGEWLAEGWVMLEAFAIWSVILLAVATAKLLPPAASRQSAPVV